MRFARTAPLAIIIPTFNAREVTLRCLAALSQLEGQDAMVVVIDDGSSDGTALALHAAFPDAIVLPGTGDLWWTGAVDLGCRTAIGLGAKRLICLNNDNMPSSNLVTELDRQMSRIDGCISAVMARPDGRGGALRVFQAGGRLDWRGRGISLMGTGLPFEPTSQLTECDWVPGTALGFTRELFLAVGGFDPDRFPQYRGDIDFTHRAKRLGYRCVVTHAAWVINDGSQTGLDVAGPITLSAFLEGLVSLRSNYNIRETVGFAVRHCPGWLVPWNLGQFYARYAYAAIKQRVHARRLR